MAKKTLWIERKNTWWLGFLGFLGFLGIYGFSTTPWNFLLFFHFLWFIHFLKLRKR